MRERRSDGGKRIRKMRVAVMMLFGACTQPAQDAPPGEAAPATTAESGQARATLRDAQGVEVGTATFTQEAGSGVQIAIQVNGLQAGRHGVHIHGVGACEAGGETAFSSAGDHFNPGNRQHGLENPEGPHAGDMPNLEVGADGSGTLTFTSGNVTLASGATSLFDADGSALVVHAGADDQMTDPSGNSGDRIACGVIERS